MQSGCEDWNTNCWEECKPAQLLCKSLGFSNKIKHTFPWDPVNPLLDVYPTEMNASIYTGSNKNVQSSFIHDP